MANAYTSTGSSSLGGTVGDAGLVQKAYDRLIYFALRSQPMLSEVADVRQSPGTLPGSSVTIQTYNDLAAATTPLTETTDPDAAAIGTPDKITVTLNEYGNAVLSTEKLSLLSLANVDPAIANLVAYNMADSVDKLAAAALIGGTNVLYATGGSTTPTATNEVAAEDIISAADIRKAVAKLRSNSAVPRKGSLYWVGIHPEVSHDLRAETGAASWRDPHVYQSNDKIWNGEVGAFEGGYFVETPRMTVAADGASSGNVYRTIIAGQQALAKVVAKDPGIVFGNVTDKLMRFRPVGWKGTFGFGRLREDALYRIESSSSIA